MADFPTYGILEMDGYGENPSSAVLRSEMEKGPPKQAMVKSRVTVRRPVKYRYTATEYANWKVWFRDSIARGADWFNWDDPADGVTKLARIVALNPPYKAAPHTISEGAALGWTVSFFIETWDS